MSLIACRCVIYYSQNASFLFSLRDEKFLQFYLFTAQHTYRFGAYTHGNASAMSLGVHRLRLAPFRQLSFSYLLE